MRRHIIHIQIFSKKIHIDLLSRKKMSDYLSSLPVKLIHKILDNIVMFCFAGNRVRCLARTQPSLYYTNKNVVCFTYHTTIYITIENKEKEEERRHDRNIERR
jgi:hypothetical protein